MTSFLGMSALTRGGMPHVVEPAGFEPATFPLRTGRPATGRRPRNAPDRIRTRNLWFRGPTLRIRLSRKGVHPPMRRHASPHGRGWETDHGAGMVPDEAEESTRLACHRSRARREYGVACGRRSRHEPLRAPGRTRSGDLPLTRRTLCLLSYRGECRNPPAVRRRPHAPATWDRTGRRGMPSSGPRGAPFPRHGPARTRRPDSAGTGPPLRAPWRSRTSVHGFGDRRAAAVPMARSLLPLFGFQPCHAGRVRGGMAWYAFPDGRPTERVPPTEWFRAASLRRPTRSIRAVPPDRAARPTGIPSSHEILRTSGTAGGWWWREDSNLRCFPVADLQSAAVAAGPRHRCIAFARHGAMRTAPGSSIPASSWEMDQGRGAAGNRTRVWPAVNHCLPSRAYPTLDAHPWTGAFGEPARLVDDVRMLAGRIHRPTVRPVRFEVLRF